jgi:hypothetical protein
VTFLGADTPFDTLEASARTLRPTLVVLATVDESKLSMHADAIAALAASTPVAVAAPVDAQRIHDLGARALTGPIADCAEQTASYA